MLFGTNKQSVFCVSRQTQRRVITYPSGKHGEVVCVVCDVVHSEPDKTRRHWFYHYLIEICSCGKVFYKFNSSRNHSARNCPQRRVGACFVDGSAVGFGAFSKWLRCQAGLSLERQEQVSRLVVCRIRCLAVSWNVTIRASPQQANFVEAHHRRFQTVLNIFGEKEVSHF